MKQSELIEFWERTRKAWRDGALAPLGGPHQKNALSDVSITEWMPRDSKYMAPLDAMKPRRDEWLYGNSHECDVLLTNQRMAIRNRDTGVYEIHELSDITSYMDSGWWTKSITLIFRDGTKRVYQGLDGSLKEAYVMLAMSMRNAPSMPLSAAPLQVKRPPPPYSGQGEFIFLTYKREDMPRISAHLNNLLEKGYNVWYDKGIPGSAEWAATIERRIADCKMQLVFLSTEAAESRWVRREIQYADAKSKPIVTVILGRPNLQYGLDIILSQNQMIFEDSDQFAEELCNAVEYAKRK